MMRDRDQIMIFTYFEKYRNKLREDYELLRVLTQINKLKNIY